ncbi:MAG: porphobilinogen synthase [Candidatus Schekmanbacteria bacterium]|nr:porphobilinogen synthase [Candidatus Schekmanbacteria bacterium]
MFFPTYRPRRLRETPNLRRLVRETRLSVENLVYPVFVTHGTNVKREIPSMPGNYHYSVDTLVNEAREVAALGVPALLLFGLPDKKDEAGSEGYAKSGIVQRSLRALKKAKPDLLLITDVCLCEYTSHGHCGVLTKDGKIDNDATLPVLAQIALSHAEAGADMVAPSDMMDGRVDAIRQSLDMNGHKNIPIMSYAAKYASGFYGPFREAALSTPQSGDRCSHQMDPANSLEALREVALDVDEGADIIMVKPALAYLDIIAKVKEEFNLPVAAYNVSGEYSMVKAAAANGWIDGERVMMEILTGIKRAGADIIITYHAKAAAKVLGR